MFPTGHAGIRAYLDLFCRCGCCPAGSMPTPPPPANSAYESLETDVKPGEPGSKVTMWLHGSGYIITSTLDFLYTMGFMYSQSSQSTLLLVEYPMVPPPPPPSPPSLIALTVRPAASGSRMAVSDSARPHDEDVRHAGCLVGCHFCPHPGVCRELFSEPSRRSSSTAGTM